MSMTGTGPKTSVSRSTGVKSMTGFAQARAETKGWNLRLTLRSVNHRFLDLHLHLPEGFEAIEPQIRQSVREQVRRGHVDVTLNCEPVGPAAVGVNREVAAAYLEAAEALGRQYGVKAEPDLAAILRLPGVIAPPVTSIGDFEALGDVVVGCLKEALEKLDHMRASEGHHLAEELFGRLRSIRELAGRIEKLMERVRPEYARKLEQRLKELLEETPIDPARVAQEAAMVAERSDATEELARLRSHVGQFESLLASASEVGKRLDFLLQEMQREANTMLSKTPGNDAEGLEITRLALEVKSDIEKLREQVQNIE
jgi:uncharacterized protein (TIGR00255 family)